MSFVINKEGNIEGVSLDKSSGLKQYDEMLIHAVNSVKKKCKPAKHHGMSVNYRFKISISFDDY
ncbi:energy transducer TonB [Kaistella sp.]|uniref:energy transducer TonB n=1 Tax=Kaistella sp. TaxID=2782235 RepID=UPI003C4721E8